jgi:hypothetical protein
MNTTRAYTHKTFVHHVSITRVDTTGQVMVSFRRFNPALPSFLQVSHYFMKPTQPCLVSLCAVCNRASRNQDTSICLYPDGWSFCRPRVRPETA